MRQNLSQSVAARLLASVKSGEFAVGEKLPTERELMVLYGVGRNTIREAVQSLVAQSIFDVRPGRGTVVLGVDSRRAIESEHLARLLTDTAVDDLYEFRMLLETEAASRAAERAGAKELAEVAEALRKYEIAAKEGEGAYRRDVEFHAAVARASMNSAYAAALAAVSNTLVAVRRATDTVPGAVERACLEHQAIAEFILERNPEGARAAMVMHIETARRTLAAARAAQREGDIPI